MVLQLTHPYQLPPGRVRVVGLVADILFCAAFQRSFRVELSVTNFQAHVICLLFLVICSIHLLPY